MPTRANTLKRKQKARTRKRKPGRPSKYCKSIARRIFKHVSQGVSREGSAFLAGITASTLYDWQSKIPEFSEGIKRAEARFERECVRDIRKAGKRPRNWPARAWLLERKFPGKYAKVERNVIESTTMQVAPSEEYIRAINIALGIEGPFIPLDDRSPEQKKADEQKKAEGKALSGPTSRLLPESTDASKEYSNICEEDGLPILP